MKFPRIAIVYDRLNTYGGAEKVLQALHDEFPQAPLFASVCNRERAKWLGDWKVFTSFLQSIPFAKNHHQWFGWLMPLAFESLDLSAYDVIISVTSEAAKGIITKPTQIHICYCLTPTRYLWSHTYEYEGTHFRWLKRFVFSRLREWDFAASKRPDILIGISKLVSARIETYYRRKVAAVISPPLSQTTDDRLQITKGTKEYYLVVSRLVPYKRVDLVIRTCLKRGEKLKIVGTGKDLQRLESIANRSNLIEFVGFASDAKLAELYAGASALICAQEEDFGIVSLEAQSHHVPVITYARSGIAETIREWKSGLSFEEQTVDSLSACLATSQKVAWDWSDNERHLEAFSIEQFSKKMRDVVQLAVENLRPGSVS